jgi:mRNA interferase RelE/StbE
LGPVIYTVSLTTRALRLLRKLPAAVRPMIGRAIADLAGNPRPPGVGRGPDGTYKVRVGDYRILYDIEDDRLVVLVLKVGHRSDVYRGKVR